MNPFFLWVPSQKGLFDDPPQRQKAVTLFFSVVEPSGVIHGRTRGLKTSPNPLKQRPEWMQRFGFHTMVTSPFVYRLVISFITVLFLFQSGSSAFCAPGMNWRSV